jgi:hypothetical protein
MNTPFEGSTDIDVLSDFAIVRFHVEPLLGASVLIRT